MTEHPFVLNQSYFTIVLKYRKIPPNDLLARTEYQYAKIATNGTQPNDPFPNGATVYNHEIEPLHEITFKDLQENQTYYFRARFVTLKGYVSDWSDVYVFKTGDYIVTRPIILTPNNGLENNGDSITLILNDFYKHPYYYKVSYAILEIYKLDPATGNYTYQSRLQLDPIVTQNASGVNTTAKDAIDKNIATICNKFVSNTSYMVKLNYGFQVAENSTEIHISEFTENFYFKTRPYFIEKARVLTEPVMITEVTSSVNITIPPPTVTVTSPPPVIIPPTSSPPTSTPPAAEPPAAG